MVTKDEIKTLARLARLDFDDERAASFAPEFDDIIEFANGVSDEIEGDNSSIDEVGGRSVDMRDLRSDEVAESFPCEEITQNVASENGYFPVKRVVK